MNKQKQNYVAPEAQTLVVGFEGMVCSSTNQVLGISFIADPGVAGGSLGLTDDDNNYGSF